ncbi:Gfo/Idh/MocA family protein [Microlunatus antarcticus]|uniref:Putative dehydrogenase n=1 Tax=Microlunatus antarcticus TaxID=53388 RepID=A0A7W5JUB7_9ACTN|nr:putative dehydrogenase [Microlunatus antarcticus]
MIRVGILGAAGIAPQAVIVPARRRDDLAVTAVASRNATTAARYASTHAIPTSYGSYDELLRSSEIDVVYVALPPSEHLRWSLVALAHGKHVLCEKPVTMDAVEAVELADAAEASGLHVIEAFHDHYHPLTGHLADVGRSGVLGRLTSIATSFTADNPYFPGSIRHVPALGGGALMDLGCYPVHWVRAFTGAEPFVESATYVAGFEGADESIEARLSVGDVTVALSASMAAGVPFAAPFRVEGERGSVEVDNLVLPHRGHRVTTVIDGISRTRTIGGRETYDYQLDAVADAVANNRTQATEGADFVANMTVIDAIYTAAGVPRPAPASSRTGPA